ncbi:MAG: 5-oxoprolinase subunit PxpA [Chitinophagaceae bacterium]
MKGFINCDIGEGAGNDALLIPLIQAANIACGFHAGSPAIIRETVGLCIRHGVAIGAHPSFNDRAHFGRLEMNLQEKELYELISRQLDAFYRVTREFGVNPVHVKPHGALYNMCARDRAVAAVVANAVKDFDSTLILYGLSGSIALDEAERLGLKTARESFADRTYQDDGSLTPRSQPGATISDADTVVRQVMQMIRSGTVTSISGKIIPLQIDTICIHGDGPHAVDFARAISQSLKSTDE